MSKNIVPKFLQSFFQLLVNLGIKAKNIRINNLDRIILVSMETKPSSDPKISSFLLELKHRNKLQDYRLIRCQKRIFITLEIK